MSYQSKVELSGLRSTILSFTADKGEEKNRKKVKDGRVLTVDDSTSCLSHFYPFFLHDIFLIRVILLANGFYYQNRHKFILLGEFFSSGIFTSFLFFAILSFFPRFFSRPFIFFDYILLSFPSFLSTFLFLLSFSFYLFLYVFEYLLLFFLFVLCLHFPFFFFILYFYFLAFFCL